VNGPSTTARFLERGKKQIVVKNTRLLMVFHASHSVCTAYLLWLVGGWLGLHHFYLGRHTQGIVWCVHAALTPNPVSVSHFTPHVSNLTYATLKTKNQQTTTRQKE
jgi:hypothetical protein